MVLGKRKLKRTRHVNAKRRRFARGSHRITRQVLSNNVHHFKRTVQLSSLLTIAPGGVITANFQAYQFSIGQIPNVSEFSSLWDQYRINKIKLEFIPAITEVNQATSNYMPNLHTVMDYDDANAPSALTEMMQYPGYRRTPGNRMHKRYFTPAVSMEVYRSAISTGYSTRFKQWLDFGNTDVPHYGVKLCADGYAASGQQWAWNVYATFYFSCKGVR